MRLILRHAILLVTFVILYWILKNYNYSDTDELKLSRYSGTSGNLDSKILTKEVRILFWVLTAPQFLDKKASRVKDTWGKRCKHLLFFSSVDNKTFPTIGTNTPEGKEHLTQKTVFAWNYIYKHHFNDADWFVKVDDDTYIIVENLRHFLSSKNANDLVYFGNDGELRRLSRHRNVPFMDKKYYRRGGFGLILSKAALKKYSTTPSITDSCRKDGPFEDDAMMECLTKLEVKTGNSSDSNGRSRFHSYDVKFYIGSVKEGLKQINKISEYPVSFNNVNQMETYLLEFYTYHLKLSQLATV